ncbi:MAG: hypothetical protein LBL96_03510 [Clostridiales bacterium]|jgi:hypothetical protein|nr:hypothetical protein [Clostridiales bacterium]
MPITNLIENFDEIVIFLMAAMIALSIYWLLVCRKRNRLAKFAPADNIGRSVFVYSKNNIVGRMFFHDVRFKQYGQYEATNQYGGKLNLVIKNNTIASGTQTKSDKSESPEIMQLEEEPTELARAMGVPTLLQTSLAEPVNAYSPEAERSISVQSNVNKPIPSAQPCWMFYPKRGEPYEMHNGQNYDYFGKTYTFSVCTALPPRGHFIAIFLLCLCSLAVQLYFSILAGFSCGGDYPFANALSHLQMSPGIVPDGITPGLIPYVALFMLEAIVIGFIGVSQPRRLTPEVVLSFFLLYIGYVLFPADKTLILVACVMLWRLGAMPIAKLADKFERVWLVCAALMIICALVSIGISFDFTGDIQLMRVYSAAGGLKGVGLYNGVFRMFARSVLAMGVIIEELGLRVCVLLVLMCLLVSWGWIISGARAERYVPAMICFASAVLFAACVAFAVCATALSVGIPLPFLSSDIPLTILFILCLTVCDAVKISALTQRR